MYAYISIHRYLRTSKLLETVTLPQFSKGNINLYRDIINGTE